MVGDLSVLELEGEIDIASVPRLSDAINRLINDERGRSIAVDLDSVIALDDTGLGIIIGAAGRARQHGGDLIVVASAQHLIQRLSLTRFDQAVRVVASLGAAT